MVKYWCNSDHSHQVALWLTDQHHQTGPFMGLLLVPRHLFISEIVRVSGIRTLSRRSLSVLPTQSETSP